ncbi:MAG: hypothetical protein NW226_26745 [Microscillaceae bacterium]|nr:hypothetical protein [Microscillaceae bacterium]
MIEVCDLHPLKNNKSFTNVMLLSVISKFWLYALPLSSPRPLPSAESGRFLNAWHKEILAPGGGFYV